MNTRLAGVRFGFELSGGIDSSLLPLYMARREYALGEHNACGTLMQPGTFGSRANQHKKITELENHTGLHSKRIDLDPVRHMPLGRMLHSGDSCVVPAIHSAYEAAVVDIADHMRQRGIDVVVHGNGGDELFENTPLPENAVVKNCLPPFVTQKARDLQENPMEERVPTLLSNMVTIVNASLSNIYISRDIWPASPFYDLELFNYCQALPPQFRVNKNIVRAYFEAHNWPDLIYAGKNEDFVPFFDTCMLSDQYSALIKKLAKKSATATLGYVDIEAMLAGYEAMRSGGYDNRSLSSIYQWVVAEVSLQYKDTSTS